jgi:hypothetical protein
VRGAKSRSSSSRTIDSIADRIGIWIGDPLSGLSSGLSTAATRSETMLTKSERCCGTIGVDVVAAAVVIVVADVVRAPAENNVGEFFAVSSTSAARLNVCDCCRWVRANCPAAASSAESTSSVSPESTETCAPTDPSSPC